MPGMDRSGPFGTGPIGRGMGPCRSGVAAWGRSRGFRRGGFVDWGVTPITASPEEEKAALESQKNWLESQLAAVTQKLQDLEKGA